MSTLMLPTVIGKDPSSQVEVRTEPPPVPSVSSRIDPGHPAYRQARLDLRKARKRERQARRRRA